jgi:GntR family transcriptional regulator
MRLRIDAESKVPIYVQIEEQIRALIAAGQLRPGEQLPTIRELAADLRVNYNTIARAYFELDHDGIISTQRGRGTFVAGVPDEEKMARKRHRKLHGVVRSALEEARMLGYEPPEIAEAFGEELAAWREENGDELPAGDEGADALPGRDDH